MQNPLLVMLLAATVLSAGEATAQISGRATVIDGDSLEVGGRSIRLFGIDAPESGQECRRAGRHWPCGAEATRRLAALVGGARLVCTQRDIDDFDRVVAVCRRGGTDLGAEMVRTGFALAYRQYSREYVDEEAQARGARRGVWVGEFTRPWQWRRNLARRDAAEPSAERRTNRQSGASGARNTHRCRIKGNINSDGERIYHTTDSPAYALTRIDERRGERWFCSESAARRAGWRSPR